MDNSRAKLPVIMSTLEYYDSRIKTHIANQINTTAPKSHKHAIADVTGLQAALDALGSNSSTETSSALEEAKQFTLTKIAELVNGADSSLDTLKELADAMTNNKSLIEALDTAIGKKANASDLTSHTSNKSNPHGVTLAQLGVTATADELNLLDGVTATTTEINYLTGVTSSIQVQLNGKAAISHGTHVKYAAADPLVAGTATAGTSQNVSRGDHVHPAQTTISGNAGTATTLQTARSIDGVSFNGSASITHYGTCSTAAATAAKTVALTGFTLVTGAIVFVKFTVTNTAANPTLNVNSTGAKAIMYRGSAISAGYLAANRVYAFIYDGTDWELVGDINTNTTYSLSSFGITATADELNLLDGVTVTTAEINYLDGVTSSIQAQLNSKAASSHSHSYLPLSGGTMTGVATGYANASYTTAQFRNITMSTSSPSGGSNGQIHFQYS